MYLLRGSTFKLQNYIGEYMEVVGSLDVEVDITTRERNYYHLLLFKEVGLYFLEGAGYNLFS